MSRPWHIWAVFGLCMAVVLGAMGWISAAVLRLDRAEAEARRQAILEENVRLALWRMDSALAPLIAEEHTRTYFDYSPFYPAQRAYTRMFAKIDRGEVLMPSPLLTFESPYILIHFQFGPDGRLTSPQVPTGNMRDLAEGGYTSHQRVLAMARRLDDLKTIVDGPALAGLLPFGPRPPAGQPSRLPELASRGDARGQIKRQRSRSALEGMQRASNVARQMASPQGRRIKPLVPTSDVREGLTKPVRIGSALILARRVSVNGQDYIQGCWLDWPAIRQWLIAGVTDLLPWAGLQPCLDQEARGGPRMLAALPVKLIPGAVPAEPLSALSPIRLSLVAAWACVLLAAAAVAVLLRGAVTLSERRAAFVSAVTHELRTPLTTFRMYTEMLSDGMVPDEATRRGYLSTLRSEAERLSHLVENVLAYARLERGRAGERIETVTLQQLFDGMTDRLARRAQHSDLELIVETETDLLQQPIRVAVSSVEQILFNLVDNACKYAATAADRRVHLRAVRADGSVRVSVCDHGPGIAGRDERRIFRPFFKSARDAAHSAPGVGLGLALSRRLARNMGGDLRIDHDVKDGACFTLRLPIDTSESSTSSEPRP